MTSEGRGAGRAEPLAAAARAAASGAAHAPHPSFRRRAEQALLTQPPQPPTCRVSDVEPWMSGNARGPSTAFNLLYRLGQVRHPQRAFRSQRYVTCGLPHSHHTACIAHSRTENRPSPACAPRRCPPTRCCRRRCPPPPAAQLQPTPRELWNWCHKYLRDTEVRSSALGLRTVQRARRPASACSCVHACCRPRASHCGPCFACPRLPASQASHLLP